ncbi:MAG: ATP-grasp domain-containing protein [Pseudomonadota bacterium]
MKKNLSTHSNKRVLVVGTTSDYIDWIRKACPDRALFLTAPRIRETALEDRPTDQEEILAPLTDISQIKSTLMHHLEQWDQTLSGVACFDCESMELTSMLASEYGLAYPSLDAIRLCRDKYISKQIWQKNNIPCPSTRPVNLPDEVIQFHAMTQSTVVIKPFCGSGSELVFRCKTIKDCQDAFVAVKDGLKKRAANTLFKQTRSQDYLMVVEEFIDGPEYSCDFMIENDEITIIRMTRKIKSANQPFGTITGYLIPSRLPGKLEQSKLEQSKLENILLNGARCLGIKRGLCMVDFIVNGHQIMLIEMTPRPGGDCLPFLLKESGNLDILKLTLDVAEQKLLKLNGSIPFAPHIAIRIHAQKAGVLKGFNTDLLRDDKRIKQLYFIRKPGHVITMPPYDYDSWLLGHMIIEPSDNDYPETQCLLIAKRLGVDIE